MARCSSNLSRDKSGLDFGALLFSGHGAIALKCLFGEQAALREFETKQLSLINTMKASCYGSCELIL